MEILCYIDPGSGSLILQMVLASCAGALVFFRRSIASVFSWFKRGKDPSDPQKPA